MTDRPQILQRVEQYYSGKLHQHGPCAQGADWKTAESQILRFEQLMKVCETGQAFSINDYGCGYGALADHLLSLGCVFEYHGFDISEAMINQARQLHAGAPNCHFHSSEELLQPADYSVTSGIFNVKFEAPRETWEKYVLETLHRLAKISVKGFALNCLTSYSDADRMREDLYYGDPRFYFDYAKRNFSKNVALLHDYGLYEWTMLVRT